MFAMIPNLITIGRLVRVPFVVAMIVQKDWDLAFFAFVLAGLSDAVDGFIARRFDLRSDLGAYLDAIADKALLVSIYVTLAIVGVIPSWLAIVVVFRDIMIVGAIVLSWLMDNPVPIRPLFLSKLNTTAQIAFAALILGASAFDFALIDWIGTLSFGVAALTAASAAAYLAQWLGHMKD
jgi:cardiolipin synthase